MDLTRIGKFADSISECNLAFLQEHKLPNGLSFPPSYADFAIKYGWGRLCELFLIYIPLPLHDGQYPDSWEVRSKVIKERMNDFYSSDECVSGNWSFVFEPDGSPDLTEYAIPFAMSENGDYLIWDTRNPDEHGEFPIYLIAPRFSGNIYCGKNLAEFVDYAVNRFFEHTDGATALTATFEPFVFCEKTGYYTAV